MKHPKDPRPRKLQFYKLSKVINIVVSQLLERNTGRLAAASKLSF